MYDFIFSIASFPAALLGYRVDFGALGSIYGQGKPWIAFHFEMSVFAQASIDRWMMGIVANGEGKRVRG